MFAQALKTAADEYGLALTAKQITLFERYYELLIEWNEKMNLTAITDPQEVAVKHMIDSLSCYDKAYFPDNCTVIDVGTGAGFPGLPLKIFRPDIRLTLLDSLNKRLNFLQQVISELNLVDVTLIHARAEEGGRRKDLRDKYQVAVSRAVARLNILSELCLPFVAPGGHFVALKGAQYMEEAEEAKRALGQLGAKGAEVRPVKLPGLEDRRAVIYIAKEKKTPETFPRRPGIPEKKPL